MNASNMYRVSDKRIYGQEGRLSPIIGPREKISVEASFRHIGAVYERKKDEQKEKR